MKKLSVLFVVALSIVAAVFLTAFTPVGAENAAKVVFGTEGEFPPFEFFSSNALIANVDGIDPSIAQAIAADNGWDFNMEVLEFDSLLVALQNGQLDAVIAGMTITDERKEAVDFSIPYYVATQVMIVNAESDITCAADLADKRIVVIQGYTGEEVVKDLGFPYEAFKKGADAVLELLNGKTDALVIDSATAENFIKGQDSLKIVTDDNAFDKEEYGIAVKKGQPELLDAINASLEKFLEDGTIADIVKKYSEMEF